MRRSSWLWWAAAGLGLLVAGAIFAGSFHSSGGDPTTGEPAVRPAASPAVVESATTVFCGGCHRMPDPARFSRDLWPEQIRRMYFLHSISARPDLHPPRQSDAIAFFRERAPVSLELRPPEDLPPGSVRFDAIDVAPADPNSPLAPSVSCLRPLALNPGEPPVLLACDMASGELLSINPASEKPAARLMVKLNNPAHVETCDLNADGKTDLVVADLGSFLPGDHRKGRVVWLRNDGAGGYEAVTLLENVGRVADARPGDFDGDGDQDLVVAEFGWQSTGSIRLLRNELAAGGVPKFTPQMIDKRHGTIHVPVADWNGDGRPDFLALISQEHETIELFLNEGDGRFRPQKVTAPEDPAFGSSGIETADLDGDGDADVLYTNGDTFDSHELKPYHGIQWVENRGGGEWVTHRLTDMPGAHRALAADLDGDGDQDIAAAALITEQLTGTASAAAELDSVIWLEQVRPGQFVRHGVERGQCYHAAMEVGDFDGDGRIDLAVGEFRRPGGKSPVRILRNLAAAAAANGGP